MKGGATTSVPKVGYLLLPHPTLRLYEPVLFACVLPQTYAFQLCLFHNVTQLQYRADNWNALENAAKGQDSSVAINAAGKQSSSRAQLKLPPHVVPSTAFVKGDFSSPAMIGLFLGWEGEFGDAGVRSALFAPPDNTTGLLWANDKLPNLNSDAVGAWAHGYELMIASVLHLVRS